ncbi:MAG: amidohydrolase family protein [Acidobacteriota bacterium]
MRRLLLLALPLTLSLSLLGWTHNHHEGPAMAEDAPPVDAEKAKDDWRVDAPPEGFGELEMVDLDVDEGTWMSLDVSPDGREIVFDLLGDLYLLPISGGEARNLTSGLAWDMQPRFSPDGETIAFTSDRGGGDNIWLIDRDGENARAVTDESFRLLNSPAWTPDGEFLVARKHFTSRRSLGAGEMWLYHRSGGDGLQVVEKPNEQKDLGEPALSPDGRYLYFSQDTTPGSRFEYSKDPNTQIYEIRRLDRRDGRIVDLVGGPGGAVRPTPSPDGESLAFVRRERTRSVLFLKDLESGEETPLYRDLDRDMQETWAIHGVYPTFAWLPDSSALVAWAGGKIQRIDAVTGEAVVIPFRVRDQRAVASALRLPVEVHPEEFPVRMLRWVRVSPQGDRVVFQALGYLWIRDLESGDVRRLTRQRDHGEFYPAFSRDGRSIVYTTWHDGDLGTVRVAPASGGEGRVVSQAPGHYVEPEFAPDGMSVVYRKVSGGWLRTPTWSADPGVYHQPLEGGGKPRLVTRDGFDPHFGGTSDRVFVTRFGDDRRLISLELDGDDEREHVHSKAATELRVSPDGRWLAFRERFKAFVTPLVAIGKSVEISPKGTSLPLAQVSQAAGEYLHWSGDSQRLYWALGATLSTLEVERAFAEDRGDEPLPVLEREIGFSVASDRPEGRLALVGGRVITMRGDEVLEDATVLVDGHRIVAVGARGEVDVPAGTHIVDVSGKTVIPGLVDVHWHGAMGQNGMLPQQNWGHYATLAYGVTTVHDPSNDTATVFAAAELARAGQITAPRIFSTGTILYGAKGDFKAEVDSLEDARFHVSRLQKVGAISVKSYNQPRRDQRQQVMTAARELGMMVVPEGGSLFQHNMTMVVDGHTGIEHSIPVAAIYEDVRQLWGATEVYYTPTLGVAYGGNWGEHYWYAKTKVWEDERLLTFVPRRLIDARSRRRMLAPDDEWGHIDNARVATELARRGVGVTIGAHGQREGLATHWEMWMLEQGGMTPHEALRAGTLVGARYLGFDADVGSIEVGKLADLVVLSGNPLDDLRQTTSVEHLVLNGRLYDGRSLDQVYPDRLPVEPFYWQREPGFFSRR